MVSDNGSLNAYPNTQHGGTMKDLIRTWIQAQRKRVEAENAERAAYHALIQAVDWVPNVKRLVDIWDGGNFQTHIIWKDDLGNIQYERVETLDD
jgi:hypothetical protein